MFDKKSHSATILAHVGSELPPHLSHCLRQYRRFNPDRETYFIADAQHLKPYDIFFCALNIRPVASESLKWHPHLIYFWTKPLLKVFHLCKKFWKKAWGTTGVTSQKPDFRHHVLERLFFIDRLMKKESLSNVFYFENDVMIYSDLAAIEAQINQFSYPKDIYVTPPGDERAAYGLLFVKKAGALKSFDGKRSSFGSFPTMPEELNTLSHPYFHSLFDTSYWGQAAETPDDSKNGYQILWKEEDRLKVPYVESGGHFHRLNNLRIRSKNLHQFVSETLSTYMHESFIVQIPKNEVKTIFEIGSCHALDAIRLRKHYGAQVYAFECNPEGIRMCEKNLENEKGITLVKKAVWNQDTKIKFFPVDPEKSKSPNAGASSCFVLNFKERSRPEWREECCVQSEIEVDAIRIDTFCRAEGISSIDLVCMDLEGAELQALEGFGGVLNSVKFIITEVRFEPMHYGDTAQFDQIKDFLRQKGFACCLDPGSGLFGDALFVRVQNPIAGVHP